MSDLKNNIINSVESVSSPVGNAVYNLTNKPTKAIGSVLSDIVELIFSPIHYANNRISVFFTHKIDTFKRELEEAIHKIPEEKLVEPDFQTVSLAVENAKFCITDDELRKIFVNLLAGTLNSDVNKYIHPAFSEIIRQMSSADAFVINEFSKYNILDIQNLTSLGILPEHNISIENLQRLGLLKINMKLDEENDLLMDHLYNRGVAVDLSADKGHLIIQNIELTNMGKMFTKVCCI